MNKARHVRTAILAFLSFPVLAVSFANQEIEDMKTGVVKVVTKTSGEREVTGTGFIVRLENDALYIVTASHVVEDAREVMVEFFTRRNRQAPAKVIGMEGADPRGLAVLLVERQIPSDVSALKLIGSGSVRGGDSITTLGFHLVSNVDWAVIRGNIVGQSGKTITFSGPIGGGNSGGPLIKDGKVIGIVTEVTGTLAYAIPADIAIFVLKGWGVEVTERANTGRLVSRSDSEEVSRKLLLENTKIAFMSFGNDRGVYVMNPDGANVKRLPGAQPEDAELSWSPDGTKIAFTRGAHIYVMNTDGTNRKLLTQTDFATGPTWSPDGTMLAFVSGYSTNIDGKHIGNQEIYVINANGKNERRLKRPPMPVVAPSWSPDGSKIICVSLDGQTIYMTNIESSDNREPYQIILRNVGSDQKRFYSAKWSPDGSKIAYVVRIDDSRLLERAVPRIEIHLMNADGTNDYLLTHTQAIAASPSWSPNGAKIAYHANFYNSFRTEIYVINVDGTGLKRLTNMEAANPSWSPFLR